MASSNLIGTLVYPDDTPFYGTLSLRLNGPAKDSSGNIIMPKWRNYPIGTDGVVNISIDDTDALSSIDGSDVYYQAVLNDDGSEWDMGNLKFGTGTIALADAWINSQPVPHRSLICYVPFNKMANKYPRRTGNDTGTFSSAMAYRKGKIGQGILISSKEDGTTGDQLYLSRGNQIIGNNYKNANGNQGSICCWWTPHEDPYVQRLGTESHIFSLVSLPDGTVLAGTYPSGQIYRSVDSGVSWSLVQRLGTESYILSLVSLPDGTVLAGTAPSGQIYRSVDSGVSWSLVQRLGTESYILSLVSLPDGTILAGTAPSGQIYRSVDSGVSWSLVQQLGTESRIFSLVSLPDGTILAGTDPSGQIYRSVDSGVSWSLVQRLGTEVTIRSLVSLPDGTTLAGTSPSGQIYRSVDSGVSWSLVQQLGTESHIFSLVSLPDGTVLAGTYPSGQIYRSVDSGVSWSLVQRLGTEDAIRSLVSLPDGTILAGTAPSGQIYRSVDSEISFPANIERVLFDFGAGRLFYSYGKFHLAYPNNTIRASYIYNIAIGTPILITATYDMDASITAQITVNNNAMVTSIVTSTTSAPTTTLYIGNDSNNDGSIHGIIDDLIVLDRVISSSEISDIYNSGNGTAAGLLADSNLKAYLPFDGSGNLVSGTNTSLGCSWPSGTNQNLVQNGHFEYGTNNWTIINGTFGLVTSGSNLLYDGTTMQINSSLGFEGNITQTIPVGSASNYFSSLWGHTLSPNAFSFLGYNALGSSGTTFARYEMAIQSVSVGTGTFQINATNSGTGYVDGVWLGTSLLNNGGFEGTWIGGTIPDGWTKSGAIVGTANTANKHGGNYGLQVFAGDSVTNYYQNIVTITNNKWYCFIGYLLAEAGTGYINLSGANTVTLSATQTQWTRKAHVFKAVGTSLDVRLYANSGGTCNYDDFALIELDAIDIVASPAALGSSYDTGKWGTALGALRIDGGDTFILPGTVTSPAGTNIWYGAGAISVWVKPQGWHGADGVDHTIFDIGQSGSTNRIRLQKDSSNNLVFTCWGNTANAYKQISYAVGTDSFGSNAWHHIIVGWTAADTDHLFLNGTRVGTESASGNWSNMVTLGPNLYIGSDLYGATQFDGLIDELRIFDEIPTDEQKIALYNDPEYLGYG